MSKMFDSVYWRVDRLIKKLQASGKFFMLTRKIIIQNKLLRLYRPEQKVGIWTATNKENMEGNIAIPASVSLKTGCHIYFSSI